MLFNEITELFLSLILDTKNQWKMCLSDANMSGRLIRAEPASEDRKEIIIMKKLVRLWKRPSQNGRAFKYVLIWSDEQGKERWQTLDTTDRDTPAKILQKL